MQVWAVRKCKGRSTAQLAEMPCVAQISTWFRAVASRDASRRNATACLWAYPGGGPDDPRDATAPSRSIGGTMGRLLLSNGHATASLRGHHRSGRHRRGARLPGAAAARDVREL